MVVKRTRSCVLTGMVAQWVMRIACGASSRTSGRLVWRSFRLVRGVGYPFPSTMATEPPWRSSIR